MSRLFFQADTATATPAAASEAAPAVATETPSANADFELIGHMPGAELLEGATFDRPDSTPRPDWTGQEDDEEVVTPPVVPEVVVDPNAPVVPPVETEEPIPADAPGLRKRVDKLTAQKTDLTRERDEAKASIETLKAEVAKLTANPPVQPAPVHSQSGPDLSFIASETDLAGIIADAEARKAWALENFDGGDSPFEGGEPVAMDSKAVRAMYAKAEAMLTKHAPARRVYLERQTKADDYIKARYPDMFDTSKPEGQQFAATANNFPQVKAFPNWKIILADSLRGQSIRLQEESEAAAKAEGKGAPPVAPVAPKVTATPVPAKVAGPKSVLKASMNEEELAASL